jgi:N-methylhydantoinase B
MDGLSTTAFPSGVRTSPVEAVEAEYPLVIWRKEYREGSGGAGRLRGGLGQIIEIGLENDAPFSVAAMFDRTQKAPQGRYGGLDGALGVVSLKSGKRLKSKGRQSVPPGDRLVLMLPGGGGYGQPTERAPDLVADDVRDGLVDKQAALSDYQVVLDSSGEPDLVATLSRRGALISTERENG